MDAGTDTTVRALNVVVTGLLVRAGEQGRRQLRVTLEVVGVEGIVVGEPVFIVVQTPCIQENHGPFWAIACRYQVICISFYSLLGQLGTRKHFSPSATVWGNAMGTTGLHRLASLTIAATYGNLA